MKWRTWVVDLDVLKARAQHNRAPYSAMIAAWPRPSRPQRCYLMGSTWTSTSSIGALPGCLARSLLLTGGFLELRHPLIKPANSGRQLLEASHDRRDFRASGISASRSACSGGSADEDTFPLLANDEAFTPEVIQRVANHRVRHAVHLAQLGHRRELRAHCQHSPVNLRAKVGRDLQVRRRA
jgi:hypothetical protein